MQTANTLLAKQYSTREAIKNTYIGSNILMLLAVFPYISPLNIGSDTQPFALMFSMFLISTLVIRNDLTMPKSILALLLTFVGTFVYFLVSPEKASAFRSLVGYASLCIVTYASYKTFKNIKVSWFNFSVYVWLSVGIIQLTVNRYFGSSLLPRMSTSEGRGITSLAVEPSYYAIVCVFLLLINDFLTATGKQEKKKHFIITVLLFLQIAATFSGIGFVFLFVYLISKLIAIIWTEGIAKHKGKLLIIFIALGFIFVSLRTVDVLERSRAGGILNAAMIDPRVVLITDLSIADRLSHAVLPVYSLGYSSGFGMGMGTWSTYFPTLRSYAGGFVEVMSRYATGGRIMSGWGTAIYELGVLGLIYLFIFMRVMIRGVKRRDNVSAQFVSGGITVFLIMVMAVPLAFPLFSYVLGMYMYYGNTLRQESR